MVIFYCESVPSGQYSVVLRYSLCDTYRKVKNLFSMQVHTRCTGNTDHSAFLSEYFCVFRWSSTQKPVIKCRERVLSLSVQIGNTMKMLENPDPVMHPCLQLMGAESTKMTSVSQTFPLVLHKWLVREETLTNCSQYCWHAFNWARYLSQAGFIRYEHFVLYYNTQSFMIGFGSKVRPK